MPEKRPDKNGFLLYKSQWEPIADLTDQELGQLTRAIFNYQINGTEPPRNTLVGIHFQYIKSQFNHDEGRYTEVIDKKSKAGQISAEKRKQQSQHVSTKSTGVESVQQNQHVLPMFNKSTDNVNGNDKDNVKDKDFSEEKISEAINDGLASESLTPWQKLKKHKSMSITEMVMKYNHIDVDATGQLWEKWLLQKNEVTYLEGMVKNLWNSFDYYAANAERFAKERGPKTSHPQNPKQQPYTGPTAKEICQLDQPFD